jgi:hypothetical protein
MGHPVEDDLLAVLGRERHALGTLLFRLIEARSLLASGESRFLHLAARDVEAAAAALREVELTRAMLEPLAEGITLRELVAESPSPIDGILDDYRIAIGRLAAEVGAAIEGIAELAERDLARVRGPVLASVGTSRRRSAAPVDDLDREILASGYEAMLTASSRLVLPSLVAFLG